MGTEQGISEAASENKPKRGRPSQWAGGVEALRTAARDRRFKALTDRGRADNAYAVNAIILLRKNDADDKYDWLLGTQSLAHIDGKARLLHELLGDRFPDRRPPKMALLAELGRIIDAWSDGEKWALKLADELCQMEPKPKVKEAAAWLRRWRLDGLGKAPKEKPGSADELADAICELIDRYDREHDGVTPDIALEALASAIAFYEWVAEEPEPESA